MLLYYNTLVYFGYTYFILYFTQQLTQFNKSKGRKKECIKHNPIIHA